MPREITVTRRLPEPPSDLETLRSAVRGEVDASSVNAAALEIGMSPRGLRIFLLGSVPYSPTLRRLRKWYAKSASTENEG